MKIILSRKGFDKKNGGVASPIFPDGGLCSLPIPQDWAPRDLPARRYRVRYKDLGYSTREREHIVEDLTFNPRRGTSRIIGTDFCHLDPDLIRYDRRRRAGWLPMFGQANAATSHLLNHGVGEGDLFLFFGWFRSVQNTKGRFRFDPDGKDAHVIFGWLQVGEIWCAFNADPVLPKWAWDHPHVCGDADAFCNLRKPVDAVFVARRRLSLPGIGLRRLGGGVFKKFHDDLLLSEPGKTRGHWRLPTWMYPSAGKAPMTYNVDRRKWSKGRKHCYLHTADIGQEFIIDCDEYNQKRINEWLRRVFRHAL